MHSCAFRYGLCQPRLALPNAMYSHGGISPYSAAAMNA